jgi:hypothetical protein
MSAGIPTKLLPTVEYHCLYGNDKLVFEYDPAANGSVVRDKTYQELIFPDYIDVTKYVTFTDSEHDERTRLIVINNASEVFKTTGKSWDEIGSTIRSNLILHRELTSAYKSDPYHYYEIAGWGLGIIACCVVGFMLLG